MWHTLKDRIARRRLLDEACERPNPHLAVKTFNFNDEVASNPLTSGQVSNLQCVGDLACSPGGVVATSVNGFATNGAVAGDARPVQRSRKSIETSNRLIEACVEELQTVGFDGLTIRNVASRAGVAPATAYNHFSSRELLVTEVFWRRLVALPDTMHARDATTVERVSSVLEDLACVLADEPEIASACNVAMLSSEEEVRLVRDRIGAEYHRRLSAALAGGATPSPTPCGLTNGWAPPTPVKTNPDVLYALELALSGAMLHAGMGHLSYDELPGQLRRVAEIIVSSAHLDERAIPESSQSPGKDQS